MNFLRGFLDNDSVFGQIMTRCGIIIMANLMFLLFSVPVVTIGPAWAALHYTMLRTLREKEINPFTTFWQGFKDNLKQGILAGLILAALGGVLLLEIYLSNQFPDMPEAMRLGVLALLIVVVLIGLYLFPTMAAFRAGLWQLTKNAVYFAIHRPLNMIPILLVHAVPLAVTWLDVKYQPLYAFLWFMFGFAAVAMCTDTLLLKEFEPYQTPIEGQDAPRTEKNEREQLEEMKKMGF